MIPLTLLDGQPCWINPDHILMIEARPDTLIRLSNGEKWIVKESVQAVQEAFIAYKRACFTTLTIPLASETSDD
ncbi:MAG: flagellar FlbD family protein [Vampirovibrionales bacterium]|jgi:uncharacterized protein YlzI (FlbEa/FlbD family)